MYELTYKDGPDQITWVVGTEQEVEDHLRSLGLPMPPRYDDPLTTRQE